MIGFALAVSAAALAPLAQASPATFFRRDDPSVPPSTPDPAETTSGWTGKPVISGYWPSYQSELLKPEEIPYDMYTHIDWFVASTTETYELKLDGSEEELVAVVAGAHAAGVTVSMAIGGWTGSVFFSDLVANETRRAAFTDSIKSYVDKYSLDGIDLDWEFPGVQGIGCNKINVENDSDNFLEFVKTLRQALGTASRISAAVAIGGIKGPDGELYSKTSELADHLDYMTIMAYDVYGSWSSTTGPLGPWLDRCANADGAGASGYTAYKMLTEAGFPANKLLLGMPSYSRPLITESSTLTRTAVGEYSSLFYQNFTTEIAPGGVTTAEAGVDVCGTETPKAPSWLFNELISTGKLTADASFGQGDWKRIWDHCSQTPFLFNSVTREFIPYDDPQSFETKASYASHLGMAGINMFDMTGDTRDSMLIRAARKSLLHE